MAGLLNAQTGGGSQTPPLNDPILKKIEAQLESKVPANLKQQYMGIVVSGMSIMYSEKSAQFIQQRMQASPDMAMNAAKGVADLIQLVFQNSGQNKNPQMTQAFFDASMFACITLMCQVLDMAEKVGAVRVDNTLVEKCTTATYKETMRGFGVTEQMVRDQIAKGGAQKGAVQPPQGAQAAPTQPMGAS